MTRSRGSVRRVSNGRSPASLSDPQSRDRQGPRTRINRRVPPSARPRENARRSWSSAAVRTRMGQHDSIGGPGAVDCIPASLPCRTPSVAGSRKTSARNRDGRFRSPGQRPRRAPPGGTGLRSASGQLRDDRRHAGAVGCQPTAGSAARRDREPVATADRACKRRAAPRAILGTRCTAFRWQDAGALAMGSLGRGLWSQGKVLQLGNALRRSFAASNISRSPDPSQSTGARRSARRMAPPRS